MLFSEGQACTAQAYIVERTGEFIEVREMTSSYAGGLPSYLSLLTLNA